MLPDRFPGGEKKEEEANNEKEKAAVSNQMFFQGSSYEDIWSKRHDGCGTDDQAILEVSLKHVKAAWKT